MLKKEDLKIIEFLLDAQRPVSSDEIAQFLSTSKKTALKRIGECAEFVLIYGAEIRMKKGVGFWIEVKDDDRLYQFIQFNKLSDTNDIQSDDFLIKELCSLLVNGVEYIKGEDLVDELYVSRSKLTSLLNEVRNILDNYGLRLESKPYYGMKITGSEFNMRRFIASSYIQSHFMNASNPSKIEINLSLETGVEFMGRRCEIEKIVQKQLDKKQIRMPNNIFNNLVLHLTISLLRYEKGMRVEQINDLTVTEQDAVEINLTKDILKAIENKYHIQFSEGEYQYILIHFISKKEADIKKTSISVEINRMIDQILFKIKAEKNIDLSDDFDLRSMLGLHIVPLVERIRYRIQLKNPLLAEIKSKCIAGYDLAIICAQVINKEYNTQLSENEVSYFALHFDVALNRKNALVKKKKVLLVCASGRASAQALKLRFEQHFGEYLEEIQVCDINEVEIFLEQHQVDYIFTTVPLEINKATPVFDFDFFLDRQSINKIQNVLDGEDKFNNFMDYLSEDLFFGGQSWQTKEEVIHEMVKKIRKVKTIPEHFENLVLERESYNGTDLFDMIALPHPNSAASDETFIAVATLNKPILWNTKKVKAVFLLSISRIDSEKHKFLFEILIPLISSLSAITQITQKADYQTLIKEIHKLKWGNEKG